MREFKFRAWDKKIKKIELFDSLFELQKANLTKEEFDNLVFLQYTGQKDKKGKEIFEGDILVLFEKKWICKWDDNYNKFYLKPLFMTMWAATQQAVVTENYTVIGNIYENPELLENKD